MNPSTVSELSVRHSAHDVSGAFGVFGYTGDGISKSIDHALHRKLMKTIMAAKHNELEYVKQKAVVDVDEVIKLFLKRQAVACR